MTPPRFLGSTTAMAVLCLLSFAPPLPALYRLIFAASAGLSVSIGAALWLLDRKTTRDVDELLGRRLEAQRRHPSADL